MDPCPSRAISRLLLLSPKEDNYLDSAVSAKYLTKVPGPYVDDRYADSAANTLKDRYPRDSSPEDGRVGGFGSRGIKSVSVFSTVCESVAGDSDQSMPDLDSDAFLSDDSRSSSSSETDSDSEEDYRFRSFHSQNLGTFEIYPSNMVMKRSQSITDIKKKSEQNVAAVCRSMEDLVVSGGESKSYFTLLEDIANISYLH